jgi:NNP family nitrate/nitrite transporter-like MFS transporter
MCTLGFAICFAAWLNYGVLLTWLIGKQVFEFSKSDVGWLIGIPILTGSIMRLPVGILTDRYGGRTVMTVVMLLSSVPLYCVAYVDGYWGFVAAGLGFGLSGASFAAGVAYVSVCYPRERIGTALGIFGVGNAGAALTSIGGPRLLAWLTDSGQNLEAWRSFPKIYAAILAAGAIAFWLLVPDVRNETSVSLSMGQRLAPLKRLRVWRFGLYYFLVFGAFVALSQWMIPYYVNSYQLSIADAGLLAAVFSLPSGVVRALGGWMSDKWGARSVMYWVLGTTTIGCFLLIIPRMSIESPGQGVLSTIAGTVTAVTDDKIVVESTPFAYSQKPPGMSDLHSTSTAILPQVDRWHEPIVEVGQKVNRRELLARGITHIFFEANIWIFTSILLVVGLAMGIGMAAVYKHIPEYFPDSVGVTGGMVGVLGGLGGMVCPILFGYLLHTTGVWTSCWAFLALLSLGCLCWMHIVIQRMMKRNAPELSQRMDDN